MIDLHVSYTAINRHSFSFFGTQPYYLGNGIVLTASAIKNTLTTPFTSQEHVKHVDTVVCGLGSHLPCPGGRYDRFRL